MIYCIYQDLVESECEREEIEELTPKFLALYSSRYIHLTDSTCYHSLQILSIPSPCVYCTLSPRFCHVFSVYLARLPQFQHHNLTLDAGLALTDVTTRNRFAVTGIAAGVQVGNKDAHF